MMMVVASAALAAFVSASGSNLVFRAGYSANGCTGAAIPVPGALAMRVFSDAPATNGWRRMFSSRYLPSGYFGFQEEKLPSSGFFFMHGFKGAENLNKFMKRPPSGRLATLVFNFEPRRFTYYLDGEKQGEVDLELDLSERKLGELVLGGGEKGFEVREWTLYSRPVTALEAKAIALGDGAARGSIGWYPSIRSLAVSLVCDRAKTKDGELAVTVTKRGESHPAFRGRVSLESAVSRSAAGREMLLLHEKVPLGELAAGEYVAAVSLPGDEGNALVERGFTVKAYEWEGNKVGLADRLITGFTRVTARGHVIGCVGRSYRLGADGLPESVVSLGREVLARPVELKAERDGRVVTVSGGEASFLPRVLSETALEYTAEGRYKTVRGRLEQDGLLRLDISFRRTPAVDRLYLDIPIRKEMAKLYHACGEGVRHNPAGFIPQGQGVVFGSRSIPQTHVSNFIPYVWVGEDRRGICYVADWDRGWAHCDGRDAVEIVREADGTVVMRLNFLNKPYEAGTPRTFEIALMASPVKPQPEGWRGWNDGFNAKSRVRNSACLASNPYWGCFTDWAARYPAWGDFGYVRKLAEARDTGTIDKDYVERWIDRICASTSPETVWINRKPPEEKRRYVHAHTWHAFRTARSLHGLANPVLYFYTCDSDGGSKLAEFATHRDEWARLSTGVASYRDYALWYLDKMLEAGMQGIYDDNTFVTCNFNWPSGEAWVDSDGDVHPSFGMWSKREYRRRQAVALMDRGLFPWITLHHTNGNILPTLSFGVNSMGMEWKYGKSDFQTRFSPDYIRAVCQGTQGGFFPTALDGIEGLGGDPAERRRVTRTMVAALLVHEVRPTLSRGSDGSVVTATVQKLIDWGIGEGDCTYTAYYDGENPVSCSESDVYISVYRRGRRLLAFCSSWADGDRDAALALKSGTIRSARDAETLKPLQTDGRSVGIHLAKHDFALVELDLAK